MDESSFGRLMLALVDPFGRDAEVWTRLRSRSYFTSWGWMENWLACLPRGLEPRLVVWPDRESACFVVRRFAVRRHVIASRAYYVNVSGVERLDELVVEYNGLVGRDRPLAELIDGLPTGWDEVVLPGLAADAFGGICEGDRGPYRVVVEKRIPCYQVPLARVREGAKSTSDEAMREAYAALLSGSTRSQLRRAQRLAGAYVVEVAQNAREAIAIYEELSAMHGALWRSRGEPGAFADPWFDRFHRRLIRQRYASGEIQLLRVRNADHTIGCLYNFVFGGRVHQYQSGMAMYEDPHQKPGYVTHAAAIAYNAQCGLDTYDFLCGNNRYKKSLSTDADALVWVRVQRHRLRFALEDRAVELVRKRRAARATTPPAVE